MHRRIILTIYILTSFGFWLWAIFQGCDNSTALLKSCVFTKLVGLPLIIIIVFGIPTVFLLLVWKNKSKFLSER